MMKKSTFGAVLAFLFVAAGALTAGAIYLRRREKELDEYERLLFSDDFADYEDGEDEAVYQTISDEETAAPADDAPADDKDELKF